MRVTRLRQKPHTTLPALAKLSLDAFAYLILKENALGDEALAVLAPGLLEVRHLSLADNEFSPHGLLGLPLPKLEFLELSDEPAVRAILQGNAFPSLKAIHLVRVGRSERSSHLRAGLGSRVVVSCESTGLNGLDLVERLLASA